MGSRKGEGKVARELDTEIECLLDFLWPSPAVCPVHLPKQPGLVAEHGGGLTTQQHGSRVEHA